MEKTILCSEKMKGGLALLKSNTSLHLSEIFLYSYPKISQGKSPSYMRSHCDSFGKMIQ